MVTELANGFQTVVWGGATIKVYKQVDEKLGMMSAAGNPAYMALQQIQKIDDSRVHRCKINANYFEMANASIYGSHYGVEQTPQNDYAPKQAAWLACWMDLEGKMHYSLASDYWLARKDVKFACSPYAVMIFDGKDTEAYSSACGDKNGIRNTQTALLQLPDGKFVFAVFATAVLPSFVRVWAHTLGATFLALFDSGGSSQMVVNGQVVVYTGRAIANVLTFYYDANPDQPKPVTDDDKIKALNEQVTKLNAELATSEASLKASQEKVTALSDKVAKGLAAAQSTVNLLQ